MTQEEKELLLKDLCARLIYGVIVDYKEDEYDFHHWKIATLHAPAYSQSGSLILQYILVAQSKICVLLVSVNHISVQCQV